MLTRKRITGQLIRRFIRSEQKKRRHNKTLKIKRDFPVANLLCNPFSTHIQRMNNAYYMSV